MHSRSRDNEARSIVSARLEALKQMDNRALRVEWRRYFHHDPPPRLSNHLLLLGVAWKIQAQALGGLSAATKRKLKVLAGSINDQGDIRRNRVAHLKPGAKLIREWRGDAHTVIVLEEGFEWQGKRWRSLTAVARAISGGHWSGPRFFGLLKDDRAGRD